MTGFVPDKLLQPAYVAYINKLTKNERETEIYS